MKKSLLLLTLTYLLGSCAEQKPKEPLESLQSPPPQIEIHGHRGDRGNFPENTIPAFISALNKGVDALELDVVISGDNKVVVSHEPFMSHLIMTWPSGDSISKQEEKGLNLYQMSYDSIRSYIAGVREHPQFPQQQKGATYKPLLSELIDSVEAYTRHHKLAPVKYNIEIKSKRQLYNSHQPPPEEFTKLVMNVLCDKNVLDRVYIQSFDPEVLNVMNASYPKMDLCYLVTYDDLEDNLARLNFIPQIYSPPGKKVPDSVAAAKIKEKGMELIIWNVNDPAEMRRGMELGVMAVISDFPERALEVRKNFSAERQKQREP